MKILGIETKYKRPGKVNEIRTSAVEWWRIINPLTQLQKHTGWDITIRKGLIDDEDAKEPFSERSIEAFKKMLNGVDVLWFSYMDNGVAYTYLDVLSKQMGFKFIVDVDDDLVNITPDNPVYYQYALIQSSYKNLLTTFNLAPNLSVSTKGLDQTYKKLRGGKGKGIRILPNYIDLDTYKGLGKKLHDKIVIAYFGGTTHSADVVYENERFLTAMSYILGKYKDKVEFRSTGFMIDGYLMDLPNVKWVAGSSDFYEWVKVWQRESMEWDIGVCPLEENDFNRGKSWIKYLEFSANKVPVIAQDYYPYKIIENGVNGFRARETKDWIEYLELLINSEEKRREIGENGYQNVKDNYTIQSHIGEYQSYIERLVNDSRNS